MPEEFIPVPKESPRWSLNKEDIRKWGINALIFIAPVGIIYLSSVSGAIGDLGFTWSDFRITPTVAGAMTLYVINVLLDVFRKFATKSTD